MKRTSSIVHAFCAVIIVSFSAGCSIPESGISYPYGNSIERVNLGPAGIESNAYSSNPSVSEDGRYVAFESSATNLVEGDPGTGSDIFIFDRQSNTTQVVMPAGIWQNGVSTEPMISADGRYVVFTSTATNLVTETLSGFSDIFVYDRQYDTIERASESGAGIQADGHCMIPSISGNGRYVAFQGLAANLVPGDTNNCNDIFVRDLQAHTTVRVSVSTAGTQGDAASTLPVLSQNGTYVVFPSTATNLVAGDLNGTSDIFAAPAR
ncbi:MAG: hypothetical protein EHM28_02385 [Spirochaetaceae bacterium]|nr:MAG: hypothetical protein EHM28_02385 [Spirochaetaceae bacterium]